MDVLRRWYPVRIAIRNGAVVALVALAPLINGCSSDNTTEVASAPNVGVVEPSGTSLLLQVADPEGNPIPLALISLHGDMRTADGAGRILLEDLPPGRFAARVEAPGFAPASAVAYLTAGAHAGLERRLIPLGPSIPFDAGDGGVIENDAGVRVTIPGSSLVTEDGELVTGTVDATLVPFDPETKLKLAPGPFEGTLASDGSPVNLETLVMAEVSLWQDGRHVRLAPGVKATLELPLPGRIADAHQEGEIIPAWWLDLDEGLWREDGEGTIAPSTMKPDRLAWIAEVEHFTWWNSDIDFPWDTRNCYHVSLKDANNVPLPNMAVSALGVSYNGMSGPVFTNASAEACIEIKLHGSAQIIVGSLWNPLIPPVVVTGTGPASACGGLGAPCIDLPLVVAPPVCVPGFFQTCPYSGPPGTENVGVCVTGKNYCNVTGSAWLGCAGEVKPTPETCATPYDDNCDGFIPPLSDGNACTSDQCTAAGTIQHTPVNPSDGNLCTTDACDPITGISHIVVSVNDSNACTEDSCAPATGVVHTPLSLDDGNLCTTDTCNPPSGISHINTCVGSICQNKNPNDNNACTNDWCNPSTGLIVNTPLNINDNNACTADACNPMFGVTHTPINTDDGNACTVDACNPANGAISHNPVQGINDNDACTIDLCDPGTGIITHSPVNKSDNNACTIDTCDSLTGLSHTPIDINDNDACTLDSCNPATGESAHTALNVDDGNDCTIDACDPVTGIITHTPPLLDDNNACTIDACDLGTGTVTHTPLSEINDNDACTVDTCDPASGNITHTALPQINDSNACTIDTCDGATGNVTHTALPQINDNDACTIDACDLATGIITHTALPAINDSDACTVDTCDAANGFITHTPLPQINDNNACTNDACDSVTGNITHTVLPQINDNNACTIDACDTVTGNVTHTPVPAINDNNACTNDACDSATGNITHTALPQINDNNTCTIDTCNTVTGQISHTPVNTSDNDLCTNDFCDAVTGVFHTPVNQDDNNVCTTDACDPATGVSHTPFNISDNNACTSDTCDPVAGVSHTQVPITDGNGCTTDTCDPATGNISHTPVNVDDNNACTADNCNPANSVITHTQISTDDGNACTTDGCNPASGVYHTPVNVNDNNACTNDSCNPPTGQISHTLVTITDNNACTDDTCNTSTGQISHTLVAGIDDNNVCTTDTCNTSTGQITHTMISITDNNACTIDACDPVTGVSHTPKPPCTQQITEACTFVLCDPSDGVCKVPSTPDGAAFYENFADNSKGWTLDPGNWQIGPAMTSGAAQFGNPDPASDYDGPGNPDNGVAGVNIGGFAVSTGGLANFQYITSPAIDLSSLPAAETVFLDYWRFLNSPGPAVVLNKVDVWNGSAWVNVFTSNAAITDPVWFNPQSIDVSSYKNANFRIRFGFSSINSPPQTFSSWNIDHVRLIRHLDIGC